MRRLFIPMLVSGLSLSLASCASLPSDEQLVSGIDKTQLAQMTATKRTISDPVCVDFYNNINEYQNQVQASKGRRNFINRLGLNVASAVLVGQVVPSGIGSRAGRIAAYSAAGTATSQGSRMALRELNSSDRADAKIIDVAADLGCPVKIKP